MRNYLLAVLITISVISGCVERKMTITSEPPGAVVYVSDVEIGRTPVTRTFTWYGDYDVILRMEGYETKKTHAQICPPPYEIPPFDLLSEMAPWTYHDNRYLHFTLNKLDPPTNQELIQNADMMRVKNLEPVE